MPVVFVLFFFFSSRRRHTRLQGDWSSDVCSSDLERWHDVVILKSGTARVSAAEQLRDERAVGDAAHMAILVFARKALDGTHEYRNVQRFLHEGIYSHAYGFLVLIGAGGDDDDWQQRRDPVKLVKSSPAICVRHVEVEQDQVRLMLNRAGDGFDAVARFVPPIALGFQHSGHAASHGRVVIGNQNMSKTRLGCPCLRLGERQWRAGKTSLVCGDDFSRSPQGIADGVQEIPKGKWLRKHRCNFEVGIIRHAFLGNRGGNHDDGQTHARIANPFDQFQSREVWHIVVGDQQIVMVMLQCLPSLLAVGRDIHIEASADEGLEYDLAGTFVVVRNQNSLCSSRDGSLKFHIFSVWFRCDPMFGCLWITFASAVPRAANAETQGFEGGQRRIERSVEKWLTTSTISY